MYRRSLSNLDHPMPLTRRNDGRTPRHLAMLALNVIKLVGHVPTHVKLFLSLFQIHIFIQYTLAHRFVIVRTQQITVRLGYCRVTARAVCYAEIGRNTDDVPAVN